MDEDIERNSEVFENCDLPVKRKKVVNSFKNETQERREEIFRIISLVGIKNTRKDVKALAERYKVARRTIYKDIKWVLGHYQPSDLREAKIDLRIARDRALSASLEALAYAQSPDEKIRAIAAVIAASKHMTEQLEVWGIKPKAEDMTLKPEEMVSVEEYQKFRDIVFELCPKDILDKILEKIKNG